MHLKTIIIASMLALFTSLCVAETATPVSISGIETNDETWFGDAYEEDGCFCE